MSEMYGLVDDGWAELHALLEDRARVRSQIRQVRLRGAEALYNRATGLRHSGEMHIETLRQRLGAIEARLHEIMRYGPVLEKYRESVRAEVWAQTGLLFRGVSLERRA